MKGIAEHRPRARPRYRLLRNILVVFGCLVLAAALAWVLLREYLQIDTYRPALEAKIEEATGLSASIGDLELVLRPVPAIAASGVTLGEGHFRLRAERVDLFPHLDDLLQRRIHVQRVDLTKLTVVLPKRSGELRDRFRALLEHFRNRDKSGSSIRFDFDRIQGNRAAIYLGDDREPLFVGDIDVLDVLSRTPSIEIGAAMVTLRDRVDADGRIRIVRRPKDQGGIESIRGDFNLEGLDLARLVRDEKAPKVAIGLEGRFSGPDTRSVEITLEGEVEPRPEAGQLGQSLEGPFTGRAEWDGSVFRFNDIRWEAAGLDVQGEVAVTPEGGFAVSIPEAVVGAQTLNPVFGWETSKSIAIHAHPDARVEARDVRVKSGPDRSVQLESGSVVFRGIDILREEGREIVKGLGGRATLAGDVLQLEELTAAGVRASGTVKPDLKARTATVDMTGTLELNKAMLARFIAMERLGEVGGEVTLKRVAGTFGAGKGVPEDFDLEGSIENGRVVLQLKELQDTLAGIHGTFATDNKMVKLEARGESASMGPLEAAGSYAFGERAWDGTLTVDLPRVVTTFLKKERFRETVPPLLQPFGTSTFAMTATLPAEKTPGVIQLVRQGEPALQGTVEILKKKEGYSARNIEATATLAVTPASADPLLPDLANVAGPVQVSFARDGDAGRFQGHADLTGATVTYGEYLRKREGTEAGIGIAGQAGKVWSAETLAATVAGQTIEGLWQNNRLVFPNLDIDVAKASALLPEGASGTGRITGTARLSPTTAELVLQDVGFTFKPGVTIESASGALGYAPNRLVLRDLSVRGANSQATISAVREGETWNGTVTADQLDVDRVFEVNRAARGGDEADAAEARGGEAEEARSPFQGEIEARVARLLYRGATIEEVHARVHGEGNTIALEDLSARPGGGVVSGGVTVARNTGPPWVVQGRLGLKEVGAQVLDELAFEEPKGFTGTMTGNLAFTVPLPEGTSPVNVASGSAEITATNGGFGRYGLATKILNVLRTTEIFRLRLPSARDEGLTYDTATFTAEMKDGVMEVKSFRLQRPSFAMEARGVVNFPKDDMYVRIDVHPLQTVTGLVEKVPVAKQIVRGVQKVTPFGLVAKGSPFDAQVVTQTLGMLTRSEDTRLEQERSPGEEAPEEAEEAPAQAEASPDPEPAAAAEVKPEPPAEDEQQTADADASASPGEQKEKEGWRPGQRLRRLLTPGRQEGE
jgi:hypothetical protein